MNGLLSKDFTEGDRRTAIADTLRNASGFVDLTGCTVEFRLVRASDNEVLIDDAVATIDSAVSGQVSYSWAVDEPPAVPEGEDSFECWYWWIVTNAAGKREHFPGDGKKRRLMIHKAF